MLPDPSDHFCENSVNPCRCRLFLYVFIVALALLVLYVPFQSILLLYFSPEVTHQIENAILLLLGVGIIGNYFFVKRFRE
jgi:hypothetical protein